MKGQIITIRKDHKLKLNVNATDIKSYESITLPGVDTDNALNFSGHISNICKKSSQRVGVIDHFRITFGLFFKASLGAHPFI